MSLMLRVIVLGALLISAFTTESLADSNTDQIPILIKSLDDANVRYGASLALTKLGTKAVPALRKSLASGTGDVPVWSAYTLGQIGPEAQSAVIDLNKALASSDDALRAEAAQALGKMGSAAAAAVEPLVNALSDKQVIVQSNAIIALGQIGPASKNAIPKLIIALSDNQLRMRARTALIQIGPATVKPLLNSLNNDKLRFDISVILMWVDPRAANQAKLDKATAADLPALRLVLNDLTRVPADRTAAATALASLGKEGVPVLVAAFEEPQVASIAARAIANVGSDAVPELIKLLTHEKTEVRMIATDALGYIGPEAGSAVSHLIPLLKESDRDLRYHTVRTLHRFGKKAKSAIPALTKVIIDSKESEATRQWSLKTLIVTLPETHDEVVKALIAASKEKLNYGVSSLAKQLVREIDLKAAEASGIK
ncbi:MAG: HEAT repeat domain-containing protein [Planctomycetes bacterium]|nr:HEAT repeat domain-containing protein [Planctomycetota bacterium]MCH9726276.1 HEAT repeat domain-containing protein [Planctomycetota bacterium]MCH9776664.1 HEAT repeat domain-containing protein [Planctomycetota bacterium]